MRHRVIDRARPDEVLNVTPKQVATLCRLGLVAFSGQAKDYAIQPGKDWTHIAAAIGCAS